jgi:hypothetical protein
MKFEKISPLGYRLRGFYRSRFAITVFCNLFIFVFCRKKNSFIHLNSKKSTLSIRLAYASATRDLALCLIFLFVFISLKIHRLLFRF